MTPSKEHSPTPGDKQSSSASTAAGVMVALVAALFLILLIVNGWMLHQSGMSLPHWLLIFGIELLITVAILAVFWTWLETRVFRPLRRLAEDISIVARTNPGHQPVLNANHRLGSLPFVIDELTRELLRARNEIEKAMQAAAHRSEVRSARLEAILRDLTEGVVVCNLEHQIVLFNRSARSILSPSGELGLRRPLDGLLTGQVLHSHLAELQRQHASSGGSGVVEFHCPTITPPTTTLSARMSLVVEPNDQCVGYVLTFAAPGPPAITEDEVRHSLPERPEFYDFAIFEQRSASPLLERPLAELDYTIFDTETTGLEPSKGDEIVQIAGVRVVNGRVLEAERFDRLVNPGRPIPTTSTRFHGITNEMVTHHPSIDVVLPAFHQFVGESVLVAHNAAFDLTFLRLKEPDVRVVFDHPVLDTLLLSVILHTQQQDQTLDGIAARFNVTIHNRHTALGDAIGTAKILVKMLDALAAEGIHTLRDAIQASDRVYRRRQMHKRSF